MKPKVKLVKCEFKTCVRYISPAIARRNGGLCSVHLEEALTAWAEEYSGDKCTKTVCGHVVHPGFSGHCCDRSCSNYILFCPVEHK